MPALKVFIVDDDSSVRKSLAFLLRSAGWLVETFATAEELLDIQDYKDPGCIILDIFLDGRSGLELQEEIQRKFIQLPIIYITGQGDIPMSVRAMKKGAVNFLQKPVDDLVLLSAVGEAIKLSKYILREYQEIKNFRMLMDSLTPRELQIFRLVIKGYLNKQIAGSLNIAEQTVKLHRGKITAKLGVKSVAELAHIAEKLNMV